MGEMNEARPRILIVDDMVINQMLLSSQLGALNVETEVCSSGEKALELYQKNHYDLILLDRHMPDMDGFETFSKLQEIFRQQGKEVPVICETADDSAEMAEELKKAGFAEVLVKPIDFGELHDMMVRRLGDLYQPSEPSRGATEEEIDAAFDELPAWVCSIPGLDVREGLKRCGGRASDYMDALAIFAASIDEKTKTVQHYLETGDERIQILRLHSLKSSARL
ncbi:MAG: response regulator, partial [Lachnospiraceae bacterium]|nr:response regulator [Lachnospiraceae bacterium]